RSFPQRPRVLQTKLHEEVVRMLTIHDGLAKRRLAGLEQLRVTAVGDRRRIKAQHAAKHETAFAELVFGHAHEPPRGKNLLRPVRACLLDRSEECHAVEHQVPGARVPAHHLHGCRSRIRARSRTLLHQQVRRSVLGGCWHRHPLTFLLLGARGESAEPRKEKKQKAAQPLWHRRSLSFSLCSQALRSHTLPPQINVHVETAVTRSQLPCLNQANTGGLRVRLLDAVGQGSRGGGKGSAEKG